MKHLQLMYARHKTNNINGNIGINSACKQNFKIFEIPIDKVGIR